MAKILRTFVEKRNDFAVDASIVLEDLRENLGVRNLSGVRLINRYDIQNITDEDFDWATKNILSDPNLDDVYSELIQDSQWHLFAVEFLPGQYDQKVDQTAKAIALYTGKEEPLVAFATVYALRGTLTPEDIGEIQNYIINPVESRRISMAPLKTLTDHATMPADIEREIGFIVWDDERIAQYHENKGFAMSVADLVHVRDYFANAEERDPSLTELKVIDTYWSDHCRHTTFLTHLEDIEIEKSSVSPAIQDAFDEYIATRNDIYGTNTLRKITLMDMATIAAKFLRKHGKLDDLDISEEINACSIEVPVSTESGTEKWLLQFKNETHNHPTEIEPFGGASTCLGGGIRDPLSGRSYVYQAMRITGAADPTTPISATLDGKLPQRQITKTAADGYSSYGNQIGLAAGLIQEVYHPNYVAKRMELGALVSASPKENVVRGTPQPGDNIVLVGGRTGRDGIGGATGSSQAHDTDSSETRGAEVQKGNPLIERNIQRLFRRPEASKLIQRCNDFGAGGVSVAIGELAPGLVVTLDDVPTKYEGLNGTELAISESQERMAVVIRAEDTQTFIDYAHEENLEATVVAVVQEEERLVLNWRGNSIVDISRAFLDTNGVGQKADSFIAGVDLADDYRVAVPEELKLDNKLEAISINLTRLEVAGQTGLVEQFDATAGGQTVLTPLGGKTQLTPENAMVAKLPVPNGKTDDCSVMSYGFVPGILEFSPFHGGAYAVTESLVRLAVVGANPETARLSMQEYFESLEDDSARWGKPTAALLGALKAQLAFKVPAIGGKDSMSGTFNDIDVPPTLACFAVNMSKASQTGSAVLQDAAKTIALLKMPVNTETHLPEWEKANEYLQSIYKNVANGTFIAADTVREGGASSSVSRMAFGNNVGVTFNDGLDFVTLFSPQIGNVVVQVEDEKTLDGFDYTLLGTVNDSETIEIEGKRTLVSELAKIWNSKLEEVFTIEADNSNVPKKDIADFTTRNEKTATVKVEKPRVLIPVLPGITGDYEAQFAFENAGADVTLHVLKTLTPVDLDESVATLAKEISKANILVLAGGMTGANEPDGSGKHYTTLLNLPTIKNAVQELLKSDGLILGLGDGFQSLVKSGLLPLGEIHPLSESDVTFAPNAIGRHVARMADVRITSTLSPWFASQNAGDVFTLPISSGEGRIVISDDLFTTLAENGQIAAQYVGSNPFSAMYSIEAMTSADGRILGKMGHCERTGENLLINIPGNKTQNIFESAVRYFQ